jgi:hypothetical protein
MFSQFVFSSARRATALTMPRVRQFCTAVKVPPPLKDVPLSPLKEMVQPGCKFNKADFSELTVPPPLWAKVFRIGWTQVGFVAVTAGLTFVNMVSNYGSAVPSPEAYVRSEVRGGELDRDPPKDPKAIIKFRNNGGNPMLLKRIVIGATVDGELVEFSSFKEVLKQALERPDARFAVSTESESFLQRGHVDRSVKGMSSMTVLTVRPKILDEDNPEAYDNEFRAALRDRAVTVRFEYKYFHVPIFGPILNGSKTCLLERK